MLYPAWASPIRKDSLQSLYKFHTTVDVLRLDLLHPVVSGNKWFKLRYYLENALKLGHTTIITFGGAYSNHIIATATACNMLGLRSIGVIRGEKPATPSNTLVDAEAAGMELYFLSREDYKEKKIPDIITETLPPNSFTIVPEGGYGLPGAAGAADIFTAANGRDYTHIISAVGTGTTLAGLSSAASPEQAVLGVTVLNHGPELPDAINALVRKTNFSLIDGYEFGGYAKKATRLIEFMNKWYSQTGIPSDFVYTGKMFFAFDDLLKKRFFPNGSKILLVHSGGLQGNRSLKKGTLIFT